VYLADVGDAFREHMYGHVIPEIELELVSFGPQPSHLHAAIRWQPLRQKQGAASTARSKQQNM